MTDAKEMVKRLRAVSTTEIETTYNLTREAADLIEQQAAEIKRLQEHCDYLVSRIWN